MAYSSSSKPSGFSSGRRRRGLGISIDDALDHKNLELLQRCVGTQGQILSRRRSGLNAQRQRELKKAVKRARHLGLLPFVD